jgi:hypothetical protein
LNESFEQRWARAQVDTKIHRSRKHDLYTFGSTALPYFFIAKSSINSGDSIVRRGEVKTEKPTLFFGGNNGSHFDGFSDNDEQNGDAMLFSRAFRFPNLNVANQGMSMEVVSRENHDLCDEMMHDLDLQRDSRTAVIEGPEDLWALSLLIYASQMTQRSAAGNVKDILDRGTPNF